MVTLSALTYEENHAHVFLRQAAQRLAELGTMGVPVLRIISLGWRLKRLDHTAIGA